jgi:hypothetical protein
VNQQLSEYRIRNTCRELLARHGKVSGRALCAELRRRYGAVGKTQRVFAIWRQLVSAATLPPEMGELHRRLAVAERSAAENLARAERAEYREQGHQDKWAMEIDRLRQELAALKGPDTGRKVFPV